MALGVGQKNMDKPESNTQSNLATQRHGKETVDHMFQFRKSLKNINSLEY